MQDKQVDADAIVRELGLEPHPEGGSFRETFRDETGTGRAASTAIYYLLRGNEVSAWHRIDVSEVWHWYSGAPLELSQRSDDGPPESAVLGPNVLNGERPQIVIPARRWQSARSCGAWSLVGCTVAPGFEFSSFEMAQPGQF